MTCPSCNADWSVYKEALSNGGYEQAKSMIEDCTMCKRYFNTLLYPARITFDEFLKLHKMPENKIKVV